MSFLMLKSGELSWQGYTKVAKVGPVSGFFTFEAVGVEGFRAKIYLFM